MLIFAFVAVAACSNEADNRLTQTDWTNGLQPCSENRLSFRDNRIAYYPRGSGPLTMFTTESMRPDARNPALITVAALPTPQVLKHAQLQGYELDSKFRLYMRFWSAKGKLALVGVSPTLDRRWREPTVRQGGIFHLISCS